MSITPRIFFFWTASVLISTTLAIANAQNLLRNGNFDADLANWTSTPTDAAWTNSDGHSAPRELVHWSPGSFSVTSIQNISNLVPGVHTLSGWLRTSPNTTTVKFGALGCRTGLSTDVQEITVPKNTTDWKQFFVPVIVEQQQCGIYLNSTAPGDEWATLDDVDFSRTTRPIRGLEISPPVRYNTSSSHYVWGDSWTTTWGEDGRLYSIADDTKGFNNGLAPSGSNVTIATFDYTSPPNLTGRIVNSMSAFGNEAETRSQLNPEDGTSRPYMWKGNGLISVDGYLYMTVSRHSYGQNYPDFRQRAIDGTIVFSWDNGSNWWPLPAKAGDPLPESNILFPGSKFATPFFVEYGQDGGAPDVDGARQYIYAVSNGGFWDNGSSMYIGRVPRPERATRDTYNPIFDRYAWQFYDPTTSTWGALDNAQPIISSSRKLSQAGITYLPAFGRYIMMQWYYPDMNSTETDGNCGPYDVAQGGAPFPGPTTGPNFYSPWTTCVRHVRWVLYEAPHPWGPWTMVTEIDHPGGFDLGFYNPVIPNKFIASAPTARADGTWALDSWAFTTGNFMTYGQTASANPLGYFDWNTTMYTLHMLPVSFVW